MPDSSIEFENHIVILGWDDLVHRITRQLVVANKKVAVITHRPEAREIIEEAFDPANVQVYLSPLNEWNTFDRVNIEKSLKVFITLDNEEDSLVAILNLKARYDGLEFDVVISNTELEETFYTAGVTYAVSPGNIASKLTAGHLFEPEVATYTSDLLTAGGGTGEHDIQQYELLDENEYVGQTWGDLFWDLKETFNCVPIGIGWSNPNDVGRNLQKLPNDGRRLRAGDHIVLITSAEKKGALESFFGTSEGIGR